MAQTLDETEDLINKPELDEERSACFDLALQVSQLQARAFKEVQIMLRQEQAKRMSLAEKVDTLQESLHEALTKIAEANGQHQRLVEVVGELRDDLRHSVETHKKLREELAEEVSARGAAARTLKEESLIQKYDLVRLVNQETEARETLKDTVLQHEVKLSQQAESIMLIRKEACDTKLATNKLVEDTLNECKVTVTGAATRAASALEQEIEKARAAESEMVARANVLESSCRTLKSDLQEAAAAHAALRDHVDQHTDPQLSQLAKQHGDLEASTLASQTELKDTLDKIHRHVREDLRLELNQMQENHVLTEKNLNSEQNAMSSLICRMQAVETHMAATENRYKSEEVERDEFKILMHRADHQLKEFAGLKTRVDGMGIQCNRQGVLIQNVQEKLGNHIQNMSSLHQLPNRTLV